MPRFEISGSSVELPRNIALLDTNVLVGIIDERDQHHEQATLFLEGGDDYQLLVPPPVVFEACAILIRHRDLSVAARLVTWLLTPGNAMIFPSPHASPGVAEALRDHSLWMQRYKVDYVDAYLMEIAHQLTMQCGLRPSTPIVTFDTSDFYKCGLGGYSFSLYDMRELALVEFSRASAPR
jgi:predicted nucleic acid-binding protein